MRAPTHTLAATLLALAAAGCGEEAPASVTHDAGPDATGDGGACASGEVVDDAGACRVPGPRGPCAPGELSVDGGCSPAGITACGAGFEPDGAMACRAILPAEPCGPGLTALPGETACHEVAPCGAPPWGSIPTRAMTQFVDASYPGADSDGSAQKPWKTVQAAVDAAAPGAIVAVAAGSYAEDVVIAGKPVRLWGRCPALVSLTGQSPDGAAVEVGAAADGAEIRGLGITGPGRGILGRSSLDTVIEHVWVHDVGKYAIEIWDEAGPASAKVTGSLLEGTNHVGVLVYGADVTLEGVEARGVAGGQDSRGFEISFDPDTQRRSNVTIRSSYVLRGAWAGVYVTASDVVMETTLVRALEDPPPPGLGPAIGMLVNAGIDDDTERSHATVRESIVETFGRSGIEVSNSDLAVESTVVRDGRGNPSDQIAGAGITITATVPSVAEHPTATLVSSVIEKVHTYGIAGAASDLTVESVIVRDVDSQLSDGLFGRGLGAERNTKTGQGATLKLRGSRIERARELGIGVLGADATIDSTAILDTRPRAADQLFGRGVVVQLALETGAPESAKLTNTLVDGSYEAGLYVAGAVVVLEDSAIRGTHAGPGAGFGDGVLASAAYSASGEIEADVTIRGSSIEDSPRAGVSSFAGKISIGSTRLECNAIDLDGEDFQSGTFEFADLGGNACGCADVPRPCKTLSTNLSAPDPI